MEFGKISYNLVTTDTKFVSPWYFSIIPHCEIGRLNVEKEGEGGFLLVVSEIARRTITAENGYSLMEILI